MVRQVAQLRQVAQDQEEEENVREKSRVLVPQSQAAALPRHQEEEETD